MHSSAEHTSVMLHEAVDQLLQDRTGFYVDGTFGRGGHSQLILQQLDRQGRLLAIDKDPQAVAIAETKFAEDDRFRIKHGSFAQLQDFVDEAGQSGRVDGVLLDLGVSSPQVDTAERGFSFLKDGPLDMRMNNTYGQTAQEWLTTAAEKEIADVIYQYGEERYSRRLARAIVNARQKQQLTGTTQLAEIIKIAHPAWEKGKHPATRSFQAIRIFINNELGDLQTCLVQIMEALKLGGRLVVISFHSLEDRMVKQFIQRQVKGGNIPMNIPLRDEQINKRLRKVGKAIKVSDQEKHENIRARSAVMRVAEKIA